MKIEVELLVNPKTLINYAFDSKGNGHSLKDLTKEQLENFAEEYKQAIIKKHSK